MDLLKVKTKLDNFTEKMIIQRNRRGVFKRMSSTSVFLRVGEEKSNRNID